MPDRLIILPGAIDEAAEAYKWHEERQPGLGERFLESLDDCIASIRENPQGYAVVRKRYRAALVRRFPFAVYYEWIKGLVTIYTVFHCAQDPKKLRKRLP